jgi:muramoyltetrapeptide carboxypeptidase
MINSLPTIIPPYLKPGDTIGITCPAGYFPSQDVQPSVQALESWGYRVKVGKTVGAQDNQFAGTDEERAKDLQEMLDDPSINAIMCARGGYGTVRIIDRINFNPFYLHPKWIIGYSDITVLHSYIQSQMHIPTIHGEMCIDLKYGTQDASAMSIKNVIAGEKIDYKIPSNPMNRLGKVDGMLVGGNLSLLISQLGSCSDIDTEYKILFIEDVDEYLYNIDRMMYALLRAGKLSFLKGLLVGGFTHLKTDDKIPFGQTAYEIIWDKVKNFNYPVCFGFPAGHEFNNYSIKLGMNYKLKVAETHCKLKEL